MSLGMSVEGRDRRARGIMSHSLTILSTERQQDDTIDIQIQQWHGGTHHPEASSVKGVMHSFWDPHSFGNPRKPFARARFALDPTPTPDDTQPFHRTSDGKIEFEEARMEIHRPYPFKVGDAWLIAVRRSSRDGDVKLYQLT